MHYIIHIIYSMFNEYDAIRQDTDKRKDERTDNVQILISQALNEPLLNNNLQPDSERNVWGLRISFILNHLLNLFSVMFMVTARLVD